jgi:hypothetical protein
MSERINSPNEMHVRRGSLGRSTFPTTKRAFTSGVTFFIDVGRVQVNQRPVCRTTTTAEPTFSHVPYWKWACRLLVLVLVTSPQECSSDYNVILPEICNHVGKLNLTWIQSMVHLGIREEQVQHALNILNPEGEIFYRFS